MIYPLKLGKVKADISISYEFKIKCISGKLIANYSI